MEVSSESTHSDTVTEYAGARPYRLSLAVVQESLGKWPQLVLQKEKREHVQTTAKVREISKK